jgi:hypothetical protein
MQEPDRQTRIQEQDAKGGSNEGVVRWVLLFSLGLAILALTIIWVTGALTQDSIESQGTATGRAEAVAEAAGREEGLAEQADLIAPGTTEDTQSPATSQPGVAPDPE